MNTRVNNIIKAWRGRIRSAALYVICLLLPVVTGLVLERFEPSVRRTAGMAFLLEVLAVAALGDSVLAILTSLTAALTYSYNFLPPENSFAVSAPENVTALVAFVITAVAGSQLSVRAEQRAIEARRRQEEMEKLQRFSSSLLSADTLNAAASEIVKEAVVQFGFSGAKLDLLYGPAGGERSFAFGDPAASPRTKLALDSTVRADLLLAGTMLSDELQRAFANVASLILDRAQGIEDRVRFEAEQRSDDLHNTVLNALAHNFRTPLTSIKIASSTLLKSQRVRADDGFESDQQHDLLQAIDEEADRLQSLIRESLQFARLSAQGTPNRGVLCDVQELVQGVCRKLDRYIRPERIQFRFDPDLPAIRGDKLLLEQMLHQVLDNAWKYSAPGARIWISAQVSGAELVLTVKNEGPRVPEQDKERIFERFARGAANRTKIEGTGLGLAIARTIAQSYGGRMWLENEPEGPAFRFAIPTE